MQRKVSYTLIFATIVCIVCAVVVSSAAVSLKEMQDVNAELDKQKNVLQAAGLMEIDETVSAEDVQTRFSSIEARLVELETGEELDETPVGFDQTRAALDSETSSVAPPNRAQIRRVPDKALVYKRYDEGGNLDLLILPIEGKGLWSTLKGFIALDSDLQTVRGITFYEHKETPGLGGEVDNPKWKAGWVGRQIYGPDGEPQLEVIKGSAPPPDQAPYKVDGLAGATITARGVTHMIDFWLGESGFGPYIERLRGEEAA